MDNSTILKVDSNDQFEVSLAISVHYENRTFLFEVSMRNKVKSIAQTKVFCGNEFEQAVDCYNNAVLLLI